MCFKAKIHHFHTIEKLSGKNLFFEASWQRGLNLLLYKVITFYFIYLFGLETKSPEARYPSPICPDPYLADTLI